MKSALLDRLAVDHSFDTLVRCSSKFDDEVHGHEVGCGLW